MTRRSKWNKDRGYIVSKENVPDRAAALGTASLLAVRASLKDAREHSAVAVGPKKQETRVKKIFITRMQSFDVMTKIRELYDEEKGRYKLDASDTTIASSMGYPCSPITVASIRKEIFGTFKTPPSSALETLTLRITAIEEFLAESAGYKPITS